MGFREFVCLMAALIACNALGIDSMLPALPDIGRSLGASAENQRQWVIGAYTLSFGLTNIVYGPLADRFGRRAMTLIGLGLYVATSLIAGLAQDFSAMVVMRALQGSAAACVRVLAMAIIRDRYEGRQMAQVMSLTFVIFLAVPMLAPSLGQVILIFAPWRAIFLLLGAFGAATAFWFGLRMDETLDPANRRPLAVRPLLEAGRIVLTDKASLGYSIALSCSFGAMIGFINSAQQIFGDTYGAPVIFPQIFALCAGGMALAQFANSRVVMRLGSRLVAHGAVIAFILLTGGHLLKVWISTDTLLSFTLFQCAIMFCSGLLGANFGAMAMENMGAVAGTAASIQGSISTSLGAVVGIAIGQGFDGSIWPILWGYFIAGIGMMGAVLYAERGRLFRNPPPIAERIGQ